MRRQPVRVIACAWGKAYVDRLLNYTVASLLAPGNLPALVESFDCTLIVVTEEKLFKYVDSDPSTRRVGVLCAVRLISLDDLIGEPSQYQISRAYALFRGFSDLGAAMTETYLLFLDADSVLADGCCESLIPYMLRGEPVLLAPSYCVTEEEVEPELEKLRRSDGALTIPPRQLARLAIDYRHNILRAKTISQQGVHYKNMDQLYWKIDNDTIIGYQMPISMVAMRPEMALEEINTFWEWGIAYEFCPSRKLTVLGNSDEFLILQLLCESAHFDSIRLGPATTNAAVRTSIYLTQYQLDSARFLLTLHAKAIPKDIEQPRLKLAGFLHEVRKGYRKGPLLNHRNHPHWVYHKLHLARKLELGKLRQQLSRLCSGYAEERSRMLHLRDTIRRLSGAGFIFPDFAPIAQLELSFLEGFAGHDVLLHKHDRDDSVVLPQASSIIERSFEAALEELAKRYQGARRALEVSLAEIEQLSLPTMNDFLEHIASVDTRGENGNGSVSGGVRGIAARTVVSLFDSVPHTRCWHPLHYVYRHISAALDQAENAECGILFVGKRGRLSSRIGPQVRNRCLCISTAGLLRPEVKSAVDEPWCGLSLIELGRGDFQHVHKFYWAVLPHMLTSGHIVMFWANYGCDSDQTLRQMLVQTSEMKNEGASVHFITSAYGWGGLDLLRAAEGGTPSPRFGLLIAKLLKLVGQRLFGYRLTVVDTAGGNCLGMVIDLKVGRQPNADITGGTQSIEAKASGGPRSRPGPIREV